MLVVPVEREKVNRYRNNDQYNEFAIVPLQRDHDDQVHEKYPEAVSQPLNWNSYHGIQQSKKRERVSRQVGSGIWYTNSSTNMVNGHQKEAGGGKDQQGWLRISPWDDYDVQ